MSMPFEGLPDEDDWEELSRAQEVRDRLIGLIDDLFREHSTSVRTLTDPETGESAEILAGVFNIYDDDMEPAHNRPPERGIVIARAVLASGLVEHELDATDGLRTYNSWHLSSEQELSHLSVMSDGTFLDYLSNADFGDPTHTMLAEALDYNQGLELENIRSEVAGRVTVSSEFQW